MVATATLLAVCTAPLFVALVARWAFGERLTFRVAGALAFGVFGTILIIGVDGLAGLVNPRWWTGNALALAAALCYGGYILVGKRLTGELPPIRIVAVAFTLGAVFLLPFLRFPGPSWEAWGMILYLGMVPTGVAYMFYIAGLNRTTATQASIAALLEPLTATLWQCSSWRASQPLGVGGALLFYPCFCWLLREGAAAGGDIVPVRGLERLSARAGWHRGLIAETKRNTTRGFFNGLCDHFLAG